MDVSWSSFSNIEVPSGTFSRNGGVSKGPYRSLNLGENVGDDPLCVRENISRCVNALSPSPCARLQQTHSDLVCVVDGPGLYEGDALITSTPGLALLVRHADCQAAVFYAPTQRVIAAVHSGWRGLVQDIYGKTILKMEKQFNIDPAELRVAISPSLGPKHAEFLSFAKEFPEEYHSFFSESCHGNLPAIGCMQLCRRGVLRENIQVDPRCTFEEESSFFSYRRDGVTGRNGTLIALEPIA